ncbi:hypothetical protein LEP1GSC132_4019 [Leptospira kirschneri str. 200803703]|nr:hypothetical protein LEP1GSC046_0951 [Leptospira kirschneri serovar Bim str. 1051]EMN26970.1 hypothetical protein LEP1GSC065_1095 [Leptospira kirschneri serovar Sokoine str. RM1]EMO66638.1 hypothetical protein LEP1GSC132_4019 [Leptospira kirschneri str. 200803703]EMO76824.1 hypothetical protein LEP1GSC127_3116 [Leptospira kirschneri str. 200801925]EPG49322.1 hypothetical protein LEP1GSC049_0071 [Leptospira kirschneri serovar Cynopteri str. 3522 CT]
MLLKRFNPIRKIYPKYVSITTHYIYKYNLRNILFFRVVLNY